MNYRIGRIDVAFRDSPASEILQQNLLPVRTAETNAPQLEFRFVNRLPTMTGGGHARIDRFKISDRSVQIHEALWHYDVSCDDDRTLQVLVAPKPEGTVERHWRDLKKSWRYLHVFGRSGYLHRVRGFCFSGYVPMVQLALVKNGATFCHSSAIERNGEAVLFPAWGGVGKTGIMSRYVEQGWNFLADDLCVLDETGRANIHPLPMHIYKYHEIQCNDLVQRMLRQSPAWDRRLWSVCGRVKRPNKMVRWINPSQVFGEDRLSRGAKVAKVFHLRRNHDCSTFSHEVLEPAEVAARIASNLFEEINWPPQFAAAVRSCRPLRFVPEVGDIYAKVRQTCLSALQQAACFAIAIPQQATVADTQAYLDGQGLM